MHEDEDDDEDEDEDEGVIWESRRSRAGSTYGPIGPGPRAPRLGGPCTYKTPPLEKKEAKKK